MELTPAQTEVLNDLREMFINEPSAIIVPTEVYPIRNNASNGKRRALKGLVKKGILEKHPDYPQYNNFYRFVQEQQEIMNYVHDIALSTGVQIRFDDLADALGMVKRIVESE